MSSVDVPAVPAAPAARVASRRAWFLVVVAALGYFVDIYDLLLFSIVRTPSLTAIGVPKEELFDQGVILINAQMVGLLLGGILWGILGDKRGRLQVLFASILLYSVANIANGFVDNVTSYAVLRLVAGIGLAGELGAGITLVVETIPKEVRSIATALVAAVGIAGAICAVFVAAHTSWSTAYFVGGGLGIALLLLRIGAFESQLFDKVKATASISRGNFFALFTSAARLRKYVALILVAVPIWYVVGILITFSPEIAKAMGLPDVPAPRAILACYVGLVSGDVVSGVLSHVWRTRKKVVALFLALTVASVVAYFLVGTSSLEVFYVCCGCVGFASGYWAVFMANVSETFGTNLRATATTTTPNFVRGMLVPVSTLFSLLKPSAGVVGSAMIVGVITIVVAWIAWAMLDETFGKDLDFVE